MTGGRTAQRGDLGGDLVRIFTGYEHPAAGYIAQWNLVVAAIKQCARRAAEFGVTIGVLMGRIRTFEHVADPYVSFLYALPHASLVPLMVIWLGFEFKFRLAYVVVSAVFPVIINTMTGVKNVSPDLLDTGHAFCANERQKLWTIVLPSCTPYIFAGARQAFSAAWVGVVVSEMIATLTGVGGKILHYVNQFRTADMLIYILMIMSVAIAIQGLSSLLQARLAPWQRPERT